MSGQFYWAWQLAASPSIVYDALRADVGYTERQPQRTFVLVLNKVLSLMGFSAALHEMYEHWLLPRSKIVVSSQIVEKRTGRIEFYVTVGNDGNMSTVLAIDEAATTTVCKESVIRWILGIVQRVSPRIPMPRPHRGCLIIGGNNFGHMRLSAQNSYDTALLQSKEAKEKQIMYIDPPLRQFAHRITGPGVFNFCTCSDRGDVVEYTVVNNQSKDVTMGIIRLFFSMGYVSPMCIFNGHGMDGNGELVVQAAVDHTNGNIVDENRFATINFHELYTAVDVYCTRSDSACQEIRRIPPPAHLGSTLIILNASHAHLFAPAEALHSPRSSPGRSVPPPDLTADGKCVHKILALTTPASPLAPAGGALRYLRKQPHLLPEQYDAALPFIRLDKRPLPPMSRYCIDFSRAFCPFKFSAQSVLVVPEGATTVKSGVYVFRGSAAGCLMHVIYDAGAEHAILVNGGDDPQVFCDSVWMRFVMLYVNTYDIVLTRPSSDCTTGIVALMASLSFQKRQKKSTSSLPLCRRLCVDLPPRASVLANMGLYSDVVMIVDLAHKAGVQILPLSAVTTLYASSDRTLHSEHRVCVDVLAPQQRREDSGATSVGLTPQRRPGSPSPAVDEGQSLTQPSPILAASPPSRVAPPIPPFASSRESTVHQREIPEATVALLVRGWTKIARVAEPRLSQYILGDALPGTWQEAVKNATSRQSARAGDVVARVPWVKHLAFPAEY